MKKLLISSFFFALTLSAFSLKGMEANTWSNLNNLTDEIPSDVLSRFYDSFIIDSQGNFLGAMTAEIKDYATLPEILTLVANQGYAVDGNKVIDKHKPRIFSSGCKYNEDWICQFNDDIVN